ncbi:unnamed protein product [Sphagnum balticum]
MEVFIPWIEEEKGIVKVDVVMRSNQRILCLVMNLAKKINLKYYKDFRLFLERDYACRLLDDDEYLPKIMK